MKIVTVCRSGGEYGPQHAEWLGRQVLERCGVPLHVLTDYPQSAFKVCNHIASAETFSFWWSKIELFKVFIDEHVLYLDLDTVVLKDITHMCSSGPLMMLQDVYSPGRVGSGVMSWCRDYSHIYERFKREQERVMSTYVTSRMWGDQAWVEHNAGGGILRFQKVYPKQLASYKAEVLRRSSLNKKCRIIYFHGQPRPWDVNLSAYGIGPLCES